MEESSHVDGAVDEHWANVTVECQLWLRAYSEAPASTATAAACVQPKRIDLDFVRDTGHSVEVLERQAAAVVAAPVSADVQLREHTCHTR